jgi:sucrose phosphorylase
MNNSKISEGAMLNAYPDSLGGTLGDLVHVLKNPALEGVFQSLYLLPSVFHTDLDRGFSVIDYDLNKMLASVKDLESLREMGITFKFDFVLNHLSVLSKQFQDILKYGEASVYKDFFINWNAFWDGYGQMTEEGYIQPDKKYIENMFFRKPGLPILKVRMPDGKEIPYWNTFYQQIKYKKPDIQDIMNAVPMQFFCAEAIAGIVGAAIDRGEVGNDIDFGRFEEYKTDMIEILENNRRYLGQMDLNINSPLVWEFYDDTLKKLAGYGAEIVRLDAFAYAPKEPGSKNFLNEPDTWNLLEKVRELADKYELTLLPEIHSKYDEKIHEKIGEQGYITYDFFLPGLLLDAFERKTNQVLLQWIEDIRSKRIKTVNMLGSHDGIPLLDLKGILSEEQIDNLIKTVVDRGGYVKDLHGSKNIYYQVNATFYSALGEENKKLLLARAIQMFMPGRPQIWYLDLFAGKNNYEAVKKVGSGGHKEINRTNLTMNEIEAGLKNPVVQEQLTLIRFRNTFPAFGYDADLKIFESEPHILKLKWEKSGYIAVLEANLNNYSYKINALDNAGNTIDLHDKSASKPRFCVGK